MVRTRAVNEPKRQEKATSGSFWSFVLIFGAVAVAYLPALGGGFIWNDRDYVTQPQLRSLAGLGRIWFEVGATQQYYPVLHTAFWFEHLLWGDSALGYHALNLLLQATSACLFVLVLRRLRIPGASFAGLIFALHPVCVESVAWISEEKNTLSAVFYLLAALVYLRFDERRDSTVQSDRRLDRGGLRFDQGGRRPLGGGSLDLGGVKDSAARRSAATLRSATLRPGGKRDYALATALFIFALLSKSVTATLPATLLVVLWWRRGRLEWRRDVVPLLPWFVLGAAAGIFTAWVEHSVIGAEGSDFALSFIARCLVAGRAVWFYLGKLCWPANLIFIYPRWEVDPGTAWQFLFPAAALALFAMLWRLRRRTRAPLAAGLIFVGTLFPTLGFLNVYAFVFSFVADHFQYLAILPIIALAAAGWEQIGPPSPAERGPRRAVAAVVAICLLGGLTWRQSRMYRDSDTLYRTILARNPDCWMAHDNLGTLLRQSGRIGEAVYHYEQALWLKPGFAEGHNNLGVALIDSGRMAEAIPQLERAVRLRPDFPQAEDNLGSALASIGRLPEALSILERLVRRHPDLAEAHNNLGRALAQAGRMPEAAAECREALRLKPDYEEARRNLDVILQATGPIPETPP